MCICSDLPGQGSRSPLQNLAQRGAQHCRSFCNQPQPQRTHPARASWWRGTLGVPLPWPTAGRLPWRREPPLLVEGGDGFWQKLTPKPSLNNSSEWVAWWADQVNTTTWWPELSMFPGDRDVKEFARKVWAPFELPKRRGCAKSTSNDYSAPPAPHALGWDQFLPIRGMCFGGQDYRLE